MDQDWRTEAEAIRAARPRHVLFLCVANSARSQMAEGIARSLAAPSVVVKLQAFRDVRDDLRRRLAVVFAR